MREIEQMNAVINADIGLLFCEEEEDSENVNIVIVSGNIRIVTPTISSLIECRFIYVVLEHDNSPNYDKDCYFHWWLIVCSHFFYV